MTEHSAEPTGSADLCPYLTQPGGTDTASTAAAPQPGIGTNLPINAPWVRPYVLTSGRTHTQHDLFVHTMVSASESDSSFATRLPPEARSLYERVRSYTESVAELSAFCGLPLGVTRVLLSDLASAGLVLLGSQADTSPYDPDLLERVLDGLKQIV
jgi:uncharacterized protein DUF742